jgi:hypothetical protein
MPGFWDDIPGGPLQGNPTQEINQVSDNDYWSNYFKNQFAGFQPQNTPYSTTNQDQARTRQQQVIQDLQRAAMGDPNSRAQQQLKQGYDAAQSQQASLGSTMRGQSAGAAMRGVHAGQQGIQRGLAGDQQMLQVQEQQAAQQQLAQLLAQQQGQDTAQAQGMAQNSIGNAGLNDAMSQFYFGAGAGTDIAHQQLQGERGRANLGFDLEGRSIDDKFYQQLMGFGAGAAGTAASVYGNSQQGGGYRQVNGQNSIVPDYDK